VLVVIVGLGVALTVTVMRLRHNTRRLRDIAGKAGWGMHLAERLAQAVEDRIRGEYALPADQPPTGIPTTPTAM
jgi:hypothetical protein